VTNLDPKHECPQCGKSVRRLDKHIAQKHKAAKEGIEVIDPDGDVIGTVTAIEVDIREPEVR